MGRTHLCRRLLALVIALGGCGGGGEPPPDDDPGESTGGEREIAPAEDVRALGADATFADLAAAARTLDDRRDQGSDAGCLLARGWRLAADLAVAVRPLPTPEADLDDRLEAELGPVAVLSRWGRYGPGDASVALTAVTTTMPPRTEPAVVWAVTDQGVHVRRSDGAADDGAASTLEAAVEGTFGAPLGGLFVTAEAGTPLSRLAEVLAAVPAEHAGRVGLAVALAAGTRLPDAGGGEGAAENVEGLCPNGLPPLAEDDPVGSLRADQIVGSLGPLRQGAETCVGASPGPGAAGGRVVLAFRIGPDGRLAEACVVEEAAPDPGLRECLLRSARATAFPPPEPPGFVDAQLPLVLSALDSQRQRPLCD